MEKGWKIGQIGYLREIMGELKLDIWPCIELR